MPIAEPFPVYGYVIIAMGTTLVVLLVAGAFFYRCARPPHRLPLPSPPPPLPGPEDFQRTRRHPNAGAHNSATRKPASCTRLDISAIVRPNFRRALEAPAHQASITCTVQQPLQEQNTWTTGRSRRRPRLPINFPSKKHARPRPSPEKDSDSDAALHVRTVFTLQPAALECLSLPRRFTSRCRLSRVALSARSCASAARANEPNQFDVPASLSTCNFRIH